MALRNLWHNIPLFIENIELRKAKKLSLGKTVLIIWLSEIWLNMSIIWVWKKLRFHVFIFIIFFFYFFFKVVWWTNLAIFHKSETTMAKQFYYFFLVVLFCLETCVNCVANCLMTKIYPLDVILWTIKSSFLHI